MKIVIVFCIISFNKRCLCITIVRNTSISQQSRVSPCHHQLPCPANISLPPVDTSSSNKSVLEESQYLADGDGGAPECVRTENGLKLTDLGRRQLINKERKFDKFDIGDPDLQPVRSFENTTLVRLLFHACVFINAYVSFRSVTFAEIEYCPLTLMSYMLSLSSIPNVFLQ